MVFRCDREAECSLFLKILKILIIRVYVLFTCIMSFISIFFTISRKVRNIGTETVEALICRASSVFLNLFPTCSWRSQEQLPPFQSVPDKRCFVPKSLVRGKLGTGQFDFITRKYFMCCPIGSIMISQFLPQSDWHMDHPHLAAVTMR